MDCVTVNTGRKINITNQFLAVTDKLRSSFVCGPWPLSLIVYITEMNADIIPDMRIGNVGSPMSS